MSEVDNYSKTEKPKVRSKVGQWFVDLWKKFQNFLNEQFAGIFEKGKIFYTLLFFVGAIIIAFFSLGNKTSDTVKAATNIITLTFVLAFMFLMIGAFIRPISKYMFREEDWLTKTIITVLSFMLALAISITWGTLGDSDDIALTYLKFSQLVPYLFIIVFIGWNILQIHFIKDGIESISEKVDNRLIVDQMDIKKKNFASYSILIVSLIVPIITHILTVWAFWTRAQSLSDPDPARFIAWVVLIGLVILALDVWQVILFIKSKRYDAINVFGSFVYLLISLVIWFRSFGFITSLLNTLSSTGSDVFLTLGNIFLVILTAIFVLKALAKRVKKAQKINENAVPFLVFALTLMYIAGQVVMILGSVGASSTQNQVNLFNNSVLLVSSIGYYIWYSQFSLQRKNYMKRNLMTIPEVKSVMIDFAEEIKESLPSEAEKIDRTLETVLDKQKIDI
ncbi:MAG: hypothetical protein JW776_15360 [Candidatus Lokiarchaeota archaeon]|nr:hypothetical protein [Candidatus Lokiarchaeota archaeon]